MFRVTSGKRPGFYATRRSSAKPSRASDC
jgi:hypothetical protein